MQPPFPPRSALPHTSGDLVADRRFAWAEGSRAADDHAAAADLYAQTLELTPDFAAAWFGLAESQAALGRAQEAAESYARAVALRPDDPFGAAARRALLTKARADELPPAFVRALFDQYAPRFDAHLTETLGYRAPALLRAAILAGGERRYARCLDLGCGTGLSGAALRDLCDELVGVDLSPNMVEAARAKAIYDRLATGDLLAFLDAEEEAGADLVVAADVFVYLGDLAPVFAAVARALSPGGAFAFTTQALEDGDWRLLDDLRFGHSADWLGRALTQAGFRAVDIAPISARRDRGADVPGLMATARRG
ncbi:MAG: methyltransferase domain-containing protein [Rhizobiales bacterium]|nr:methyltransferase domain-containing protein [Hyphomicrobiales bacterium]